MYLAKTVGGWSTPEIGRFYNGRDHSTVCYAVQRIEALRDINPDVDGLLTVLAGEVTRLHPNDHERKVHRIPVPVMEDAESSFENQRLEALAERIANGVLSKPATLSRTESPAGELNSEVRPQPTGPTDTPSAGRRRVGCMY
jgi:hypothetical protein